MHVDRLREALHDLDFMEIVISKAGDRNADGRRSRLAGLRKADDVTASELTREAQSLAIDARLCEYHVVEMLSPQPREHLHAREEYAEARFSGQAMLKLDVAVHDVDVWVAVQHRGVVGIDEGGDVRLG
jgi:hypothetical protein